MKASISCCYYPTTVVFVDDNHFFLKSVLFELDENIKTCSFTDPIEAIEYIKDRELVSFDKCLKSCKDQEDLEGVDHGGVEHSYVDIDLFHIHKEIYNHNRFGTTVVVVVDYTMPGMNGLEFCKALQGYSFKPILITGDATFNSAVDAFNAGLINQFIPKGDPDFVYMLQDAILTLQKKQFEEFSDIIIKNLSASRSSSLNDPVFIEFIKNFLKENNIVEYYIINESGCFLLIDLEGNLSWLVVKSEDEMLAYTNTAIDNYGDEDVIRDLESREKILFLYSEDDYMDLSVDDWKEYLYPATKLIGMNNTYYYSHIKGVCHSKISTEKITSYADFLKIR